MTNSTKARQILSLILIFLLFLSTIACSAEEILVQAQTETSIENIQINEKALEDMGNYTIVHDKSVLEDVAILFWTMDMSIVPINKGDSRFYVVQ